MSYTMIFDREHKLVRVIAEGSEDMTVALEAMRGLRTDPRFLSDYRILCDFRKQTFVANESELTGLGSVLRSFFAGHRIAFVRSDSRGHDAQQYVIAMAGQKVDARIFSDHMEAENWLMAECC